MAWQHPTSKTTTGVTVRLGETDNVTVGAGVTVTSKNAMCVYGAGSGHQVAVFGSVSGKYGIFLGNDPETDSGESIRIADAAKVFGQQYGVVLLAHNSDIRNDGTISSLSVGVYLEGISSSTHTELNNTGVIDAGRTGVNVYSFFSDPEAVRVTNAGLIKGGDYCYDSNGFAVDNIHNTGRMVGELRLGDGNDSYRGRGGTLAGAAFGEDGNDRIFAGQGANIIHGGDGNDRLAGGRGADRLFGDAGADFFIFAAITDSTVKAAGRDAIEDFRRAEGDKVDLRLIDADALASGNQAFDFIGKQAFSHHAGELRYFTSSGDTIVQGDVDGDGKADFSILFDGASALRAGDFLL